MANANQPGQAGAGDQPAAEHEVTGAAGELSGGPRGGASGKPSGIRRALISVYDKTGLVDFARALVEEFGIEIISTGGTAKTLRDAGIPVTLVEQITGFPEMMDGRVKTLHPKIHAAILADRDNPEHMRQLAEQGIEPIDMVVVNLYPFEQTIAQPDCTFEQAIEMIDIGGPCLLRAAAKNHWHVLVECAPLERSDLLQFLRHPTDLRFENYRLHAALKAFRWTTAYDSKVATWLSRDEAGLPHVRFLDLQLSASGQPRYGENPHQTGEARVLPGGEGLGRPAGRSETDLSFNNYVDASAALELCAELTRAELEHRLSACANGLSACANGLSACANGLSACANESHSPRAVITGEHMTRRRLPHIERPGATYFISFRIRAGQLNEAERDIVMECCLFPQGRTAAVHAAVVMPDHVHLLLTPLEARPREWHALSTILQGVKGVSARRINELRGQSGALWEPESFDRIVRGEAGLRETIDYMYHNPETAGLCPAAEYPWSVFELDLGWDKYSQSVGLAERREFRIGQRVGESPGGRAWRQAATEPTPLPSHRLIACAPNSGRVAPVVCFIKHTNACGAAVGSDPIEAYRRAYLGDPNAAMGGILAVNFPVTAEFAAAVMETYARFGKPLKDAGAPHAPGGFFVEVWIAPSFDEQAVAVIRGEVEGQPKKDWGQRVRLLAVGDMSAPPDPNEMDYKRIAGGLLMQTRDLIGLNEDQWKIVTERKPDDREMDDLRLAWLICKHTKSNAITICRDGMLIGNGAGQMSRVMSCRIATWLAQENGHAEKLAGAAAASDAFFPFRDGPDILMNAGVTALIQPGGSKRDEDTIKACNERGVAMVFTGTRHFKH